MGIRSVSGRAVSAHIATRLKQALEAGQPRTYDELAHVARCTPRSVRNYLDGARTTLGFDVVRERGPDGRMRVRAAERDTAATIEDLGRALARELLGGIFPIAGTVLDRRPKRARARIVLCIRGAYQYTEDHLRTLRTWLVASEAQPRRLVRFGYDDDDPGERRAWPLGIVVRDTARVYLLGIPEEAESARDVRTYALERVSKMALLNEQDSGKPPKGIDTAPVEDAMDIPFSIYPGRGGVQVHVRFTPEQSKFMRNRTWHKKQHLKEHVDGSLEVRFGPAEKGEAEAWIRQWGSSVEDLSR